MELISTEELRKKLDRAEDFKLVMVLGDWEYQAMHIPGSLRINTVEEGLEALDPDDDIVVYDSGSDCAANHGYERVRCYAGGLEEWERAGHPLEGKGARTV